LNESDSYDSICSHIGQILTPYFKSIVHDKVRGTNEEDPLIQEIEKKLYETEVALQHLKKNTDIPDVKLSVHQKIQDAIDKAELNGEIEITVGQNFFEPAFLRNLQTGVNLWILDIQKVTKLDRDPKSGKIFT
jgi:hypothetical protein